ncbi:MAG: hypothetical protein LLF94_09450 [Chlamydiales bacterium]|nr:hypothetical protein [Chlamydiales bacterium]
MKLLIVFLALTLQAFGAEVFDASIEQTMLTNIRQITFTDMGFDKAGEAYFSPDDKTIIFQAVPTGCEHYQIYSMNIEEQIPRLISTGKGACTCAFFRPDGQKILFASSHEDPYLENPDYAQDVPGYKRQGGTYSWAFTPYMNVYEANLDGTDLIALTHGPNYHAECAYSHDGKKIVFASNESGTMNLYTMDADGTNLFRVTNTDNCYNGGPFFSPDDTTIVFRADRESPNDLQIYTIGVDGQNEKKHTYNDAVNWAPYWHPNGKVIAFTTSLHGHAHYEIYLVHVDSNQTIRLTHNKAFDGLPVFSNSGNQLMWTSKRDGKSSQIFLADFTMPNFNP